MSYFCGVLFGLPGLEILSRQVLERLSRHLKPCRASSMISLAE